MIKTKNYVAKDIYWEYEDFKNHIMKESGLKGKNFFKPLRILLTNAEHGPDVAEVYKYLDSSLEREFSEKSVRNLISSLRKKIPTIEIKNSYGGYYTLVTPVAKDEAFKEDLFEILEQSRNAIALSDPTKSDNPLIYVNAAFLELFGYKREELIGNNIRLLNANDSEQEGLKEIKTAIDSQKFIEVNIREYTKEGERIYDDITITPIFDKQREKLIYFLSIHKDVSQRELLLQKLQDLL